MRLFPLAAVALAMALALQVAAAPATAPATQPAAISDDQFTATLTRAGATEGGSREFVDLLRSVSSRFPVIAVSTTKGKAQWVTVNLNQMGASIDGFKLHTPPGAPMEMVWAFYGPEDRLTEWYIIGIDSDTLGFEYYHPFSSDDSRSPKIPINSSLIVQNLDSTAMHPDKDYLIWFRISGQGPVTAHVAINFIPPQPHSDVDAFHIVRGLGIKIAGKIEP